MKCSRGVTRFLLPLKNQQHILRQTLVSIVFMFYLSELFALECHGSASKKKKSSPFHLPLPLKNDFLLCCICLDVFTDPVTIPCKHSFCKNCITQHWTLNVRNTCPMCRSAFHRRPELNVDASIAEKVHQLRQLTGRESSICSKERQDKADVLCDVCARTKRKAVKSCLMTVNLQRLFRKILQQGQFKEKTGWTVGAIREAGNTGSQDKFKLHQNCQNAVKM
uniref:RING-type domain-containing protein n=1 Tax=Amphiprion ocellaris TaxID=80972 RepID=A0AAQ5XJD0_AMPOC